MLPLYSLTDTFEWAGTSMSDWHNQREQDAHPAFSINGNEVATSDNICNKPGNNRKVIHSENCTHIYFSVLPRLPDLLHGLTKLHLCLKEIFKMLQCFICVELTSRLVATGLGGSSNCVYFMTLSLYVKKVIPQ